MSNIILTSKTNNNGTGNMKPTANPFRKPDNLDFSLAMQIMDSWSCITRNDPDWKRTTGRSLMIKLFALVPELKMAWGFPMDFNPEDLKGNTTLNGKFVGGGVKIMVGIDKAVAFLGPDMEPLEEELFDMGRRHADMLIEPAHWEAVGIAVMYTIDQVLGDKLTKEGRQAWKTFYDFIAYSMVQGLIDQRLQS